MNGVTCPNCGKKNVIKKGKRRTKFGFRQFYYCKDCRKGFTASKFLNKTYGPRVITNAITYYNLGNTLEESAKLINKRFKVNISKSSVHEWLKGFKDICTYSKLRSEVLKNYGKEIMFSKTFEHVAERQSRSDICLRGKASQPHNGLSYNFRYHKPKLEILCNEFSSLMEYVKGFEQGCPKFFDELNGDEEVMTLDPETHGKEWQKPEGYQRFEYDGDMFKITGNGVDLSVSPEHGVYALVVNQINLNLLRSSLVFNTSTLSCCFNNLSSDQIGQFNFNANAKKSTSSGSVDISLASEINSEYSSFGANFITMLSNLFINRNCDSDRENLLRISDLCSSISSKEREGECSSNSGRSDNSLAFDRSLKKEKSSFVSAINLIQTNPICLSFSNLPFLTSLPSSTSSSLLNCLAPFMTSSINRESSLRFSSNDINSATSFSILPTSSLSNPGILTTNSGILKSPITYTNNTDQNHLNRFSLLKISELYGNLEGKELYFLDENLNPVMVTEIEKAPYSGKIYDVDVPNDIILVKRNGKAVWSGNSNGKFGQGLNFNGISSYVEVNDSDSFDTINKTITIEAWIKPVLNNERNFIVAKYYLSPYNERCFGFEITEGGNVSFVLCENGTYASCHWFDSQGRVKNNTWNHVAGTSDGSTMKIYINGEQDPVTYSAPSKIYTSDNNTVSIGVWRERPETFEYYFNGIIDELRILNRALSEEEILTDYALGNGSHSVTVYGNDTSGNWNSSAVYFGIGATTTTTTSTTTSTITLTTTSTTTTTTLGTTTTTTTIPGTTTTTLPVTTTTSTTTTTTLPCTLPGDYPECGEVTLSEVVDFIILWSQDLAELEDVINLINAWASG